MTVWAVATAVAWALALAGLAAGQPESGDAEPMQAWAVVVGVAAFAGLIAALVGLLLGRRWAFVASLAVAALLLAVVAASAGDDRSLAGWFVQAMSFAGVGVVSAAGWRRTAV